MQRRLALILSLIIVAFVASGAETDPRCAGHVCGFVPPFPGPEFLADPSACGYGECPKCLVGPEWEARKQELGVGRATRTFVPSIQFDNWLSASMTSTIFRILAEEMMGFTTEPVAGFANGYDTLCCERDLINLEGWPADVIPPDDGTFSLALMSIGYEGGSGLFVAKHTVDAFPLATSYNAYKYLPEYQNIFPKGYSTPCIEATVNKTLGCVEGNYVCNNNFWTNTTCAPQGRYVPPQCEADPTSCQEVFLAETLWDSGFFESVVKNTGLKMIVVYLGYDGLQARVRANIAAGKHSIFYTFLPDVFPISIGAQRVVFPQPTQSCLDSKNADPTLSGGDCDFPTRSLAKRARRSSLAKDADFKYFFETFHLSATDMNTMLAQHTSGGGALNAYNISCNWLRQNFGRWKDFIRNTPDAASADSGSDSSRVVVGAVVGSLIGLVVVAGVTAAVYFVIQRRKLADAPKDVARIHAMFVALKRETLLWERCGDAMPELMRQYQQIVRDTAQRNHCYVAKTVNGAILVVSVTNAQIVACAVDLNRRLQQHDWSSFATQAAASANQSAPANRSSVVMLESSERRSRTSSVTADKPKTHRNSSVSNTKESSTPVADDDATHSASGSRKDDDRSQRAEVSVHFAIGVHFDRAVITKDDERRAYDYSGPAVDGAAVASDRAQGDQILVTNSVSKIGSGIDESAFAEFCGVEWGKDTMLFQLNPPGMPVRFFDPKDGADDGNVDSTAALLEQQSAGVTNKKVTVASIYLHDLEYRASRMPKSAFAKHYAARLADIHQICKEEKGHLHSFVGPRMTLSFNAVSPTPQATLRAFTAVEKIRAIEAADGDAMVTAGIAADTAIVGTFKSGSGASHDAIVSRAGEVAALLQRQCARYPRSHCLALGTMLDELSCFAVVEVVDVVKLPDVVKPRLLLAVHQLKQLDERDAEWIYHDLSGASALNLAFDQLVGGAPDALAEAERALEAATEEQRQQPGFAVLRAITQRARESQDDNPLEAALKAYAESSHTTHP